MKIIFLDIDGVLNCKFTKKEIFWFAFVSPQKIELLKQLIERSGAKVVLSSTWRRGWADMGNGICDSIDAKCYVALKSELEKYGISFLWSAAKIIDTRGFGIICIENYNLRRIALRERDALVAFEKYISI